MWSFYAAPTEVCSLCSFTVFLGSHATQSQPAAADEEEVEEPPGSSSDTIELTTPAASKLECCVGLF